MTHPDLKLKRGGGGGEGGRPGFHPYMFSSFFMSCQNKGVAGGGAGPRAPRLDPPLPFE